MVKEFTYDEVKNLLSVASSIDKHVQELKNRIQLHKEKLYYIKGFDSTMERVQGGLNKKDNKDDLLHIIDEYEKLLYKEYLKLYDKQVEVVKILKYIDDDVSKRILELKYLDGNTFEDVAEILNYGIATVFRKHNETIQKITMKLNDEIK